MIAQAYHLHMQCHAWNTVCRNWIMSVVLRDCPCHWLRCLTWLWHEVYCQIHSGTTECRVAMRFDHHLQRCHAADASKCTSGYTTALNKYACVVSTDTQGMQANNWSQVQQRSWGLVWSISAWFALSSNNKHGMQSTVEFSIIDRTSDCFAQQ